MPKADVTKKARRKPSNPIPLQGPDPRKLDPTTLALMERAPSDPAQVRLKVHVGNWIRAPGKPKPEWVLKNGAAEGQHPGVPLDYELLPIPQEVLDRPGEVPHDHPWRRVTLDADYDLVEKSHGFTIFIRPPEAHDFDCSNFYFVRVFDKNMEIVDGGPQGKHPIDVYQLPNLKVPHGRPPFLTELTWKLPAHLKWAIKYKDEVICKFGGELVVRPIAYESATQRYEGF